MGRGGEHQREPGGELVAPADLLREIAPANPAVLDLVGEQLVQGRARRVVRGLLPRTQQQRRVDRLGDAEQRHHLVSQSGAAVEMVGRDSGQLRAARRWSGDVAAAPPSRRRRRGGELRQQRRRRRARSRPHRRRPPAGGRRGPGIAPPSRARPARGRPTSLPASRVPIAKARRPSLRVAVATRAASSRDRNLRILPGVTSQQQVPPAHSQPMRKHWSGQHSMPSTTFASRSAPASGFPPAPPPPAPAEPPLPAGPRHRRRHCPLLRCRRLRCCPHPRRPFRTSQRLR